MESRGTDELLIDDLRRSYKCSRNNNTLHSNTRTWKARLSGVRLEAPFCEKGLSKQTIVSISREANWYGKTGNHVAKEVDKFGDLVDRKAGDNELSE